MALKKASKKILICLDQDLLKQMEKLKNIYRSRSDMIRQAIAFLIASHRKKDIEKEFREGFKVLQNIRKDFAERAVDLQDKPAKD